MVDRFKLSLFDRMFVTPFIVLAVVVLVYAVVGVIVTPPDSWTVELVTVLGCIMCAHLRMPIGRISGLPMLGVAVTLLAISRPASEYLLTVALWSVGLMISQTIVLRSVAIGLYVVGISFVGGVVFVVVHN